MLRLALLSVALLIVLPGCGAVIITAEDVPVTQEPQTDLDAADTDDYTDENTGLSPSTIADLDKICGDALDRVLSDSDPFMVPAMRDRLNDTVAAAAGEDPDLVRALIRAMKREVRGLEDSRDAANAGDSAAMSAASKRATDAMADVADAALELGLEVC